MVRVNLCERVPRWWAGEHRADGYRADPDGLPIDEIMPTVSASGNFRFVPSRTER